MNSKQNSKSSQGRPNSGKRKPLPKVPTHRKDGTRYPSAVSERSVQAPAALGSVSGSRRPKIDSIRNSGDLRVRVRHREYLVDVIGSSTFSNAQFAINPAVQTSFPWLSSLAQCFESYKFNSLKFMFRTESPTSYAGKVLFCIDYDVLDAPPISKQVMMQNRTSAGGPPWQNFEMVLDKPDLLKFGTQRFTRALPVPPGADAKTYDIGMFNCATVGAPVSALGEIWVEYDVELITPQPPVNIGGLPAVGSEIITAAGASISSSNFFGTAPTTLGNAIGVVSAANTVTFNQAGQYLLELSGVGSLSSVTLAVAAGSALVTALVPIISSGSALITSWRANVLVAGAQLALGIPTGTWSSGQLRIADYAYSNA